ncbi:MAG: hypothetical protein IT303_03050 [Dehalococcoidia bacterium]|nr:hypothetical protein [Dehalococcoidia bacterium]
MRRWRTPLALSACAAAILFGAAATTACGDKDGGDAAATTATGGSPGSTRTSTGSSSTASPQLDGPANKYSLLNPDDVGQNWITDIAGTFVLTAENYPKPPLFTDAASGKKLLEEWGYLGGFETGLTPEGRQTAVLNGSFYVLMEVHLFEDEAGAEKAYDYFIEKLNGTKGVSPIGTERIGNESAAYKAIQGKVAGSTLDQAVHEVVFRRGNLVALAVTVGADSLMRVDSVLSLAAMIDEKALGTRAAPTPTPTTNFTPPTFSSRTPSPSTTTSGSR